MASCLSFMGPPPPLPPCVVLLHEELLEWLAGLVELVLLDVAPNAVADLRRYVLRDDREQKVLLKMGWAASTSFRE